MCAINFEKAILDIDTVDMKNDISIKDILRAVPGSYGDFVNSTAECMNQDEELRDLIIEILNNKPESDSSDILKAVCDFYGFNKPLELVDDDDEEDFYVDTVETVTRTNGVARLAHI